MRILGAVLCISCFVLSVTFASAQSSEGLLLHEFKNYTSMEALGKVEGEGNLVDGVPHGKWEYFLVYNHKIKYYSGHYDHGKKFGQWSNYTTSPPFGYTDNFDFSRSTESWKNDRLYKYKMGQGTLQITIEKGLTEPYVTEIRRLEEAFDVIYRSTLGNNVNVGYGESMESLLTKLIPLIRQELLKSGQKSELTSWSAYGKPKLHEQYDSGVVLSSLVQNWEKTTLYSKEFYVSEILVEKVIYLEGKLGNYIEYHYNDEGSMIYMRQYVNDTVPSGRWIENYPNGDKKSQGLYSNGKRNGKWKFWSEDGVLQTVKYKNGIRQD